MPSNSYDSQFITSDHVTMDNDDITITRNEPIRVRVSVYTGVTDADASTTVTLSNLTPRAVIVGVTCMINESAGATWRVHDNQAANTAGSAYTCALVENANSRQITMASVGANLQAQAYRVMIFWTDRI